MSDSPFTIRRAVSGDEEQLARLNDDFNGPGPTPEQVRRSLESLPEVTLVAEQTGALCGFLAFQVMRSFCYASPWIEVTELYVMPTHRRLGVGAALCREAVRVAGEFGAAQIWLRTNADNEQAQRVYGRAGFEPAPEVIYRRILTADIP